MDNPLENAFSFSNRHKKLMARDAEHVSGWRYEPRVVFERGESVFQRVVHFYILHKVRQAIVMLKQERAVCYSS